jgi:hypothetical protein
MAFFFNGRKIGDVEYPILDLELRSRLPNGPAWVWYSGRTRVKGWRCFELNVFGGLMLHRWATTIQPTGVRHTPLEPEQEPFPFPTVDNIKGVVRCGRYGEPRMTEASR